MGYSQDIYDCAFLINFTDSEKVKIHIFNLVYLPNATALVFHEIVIALVMRQLLSLTSKVD